jgi:hypothetical protein
MHANVKVFEIIVTNNTTANINVLRVGFTNNTRGMILHRRISMLDKEETDFPIEISAGQTVTAFMFQDVSMLDEADAMIIQFFCDGENDLRWFAKTKWLLKREVKPAPSGKEYSIQYLPMEINSIGTFVKLFFGIAPSQNSGR